MKSVRRSGFRASETYFARSESTDPQIWRIIERNIDTPLNGEASKCAGLRCLAYHLARVQALLVYQTIRLFDAGVRQRDFTNGAARWSTVR